MAGTGSASSSGQVTPANTGEEYGNVDLPTADSAERVFNVDTESTTVAIAGAPGNADDIFIGFDDQVDSTNGFPLSPGQAITLDLDVSQDGIFAAPATGGDAARFLAIS